MKNSNIEGLMAIDSETQEVIDDVDQNSGREIPVVVVMLNGDGGQLEDGGEIDSEMELDTEHETDTFYEADAKTKIEVEDGIFEEEKEQFKRVGLSWMPESEIGRKQIKYIIGGIIQHNKRDALRKIKEDEASLRKMTVESETNEGMFPFMRILNS